MKKDGVKKKSSNLKRIVVSVLILAIIFPLLLASMSAITGLSVTGNTAHIKITGVIASGHDSFFGADAASSEEIVKNIKKAEENPRIKAILIDINSPGGSAVASEEIAAAVKGSKKPVVALIRDIGTSGAYWAASAADRIVASPLSITGSIGATASYLEFSRLMEKYGVGYERVVSGEFKDAGAPFRRLEKSEQELFQEMVELTAAYFAQSVKENRKLSDEVAEAISSGRIYTGQQALEIGLVDELGNIEKAKEVIKEKTGLESVKFAKYKVQKPFSIASLLSQQAAVVGKSMGAALLQKEELISLK